MSKDLHSATKLTLILCAKQTNLQWFGGRQKRVLRPHFVFTYDSQSNCVVKPSLLIFLPDSRDFAGFLLIWAMVWFRSFVCVSLRILFCVFFFFYVLGKMLQFLLLVMPLKWRQYFLIKSKGYITTVAGTGVAIGCRTLEEKMERNYLRLQ